MFTRLLSQFHIFLYWLLCSCVSTDATLPFMFASKAQPLSLDHVDITDSITDETSVMINKTRHNWFLFMQGGLGKSIYTLWGNKENT